jgi:thiosulfate/3-mercaptopyruvate sulfurtransferase
MDVMLMSALKEQSADLQIIDIRKDKHMSQGVIPGAVRIPYAEWRGPSDRQGQMLTELELEELLGDNGLDPEKPIVIHNQSDHIIQTGRAAIVYWILKSSGFEDIAILDGGFKSWKAADLPLAENPTILPPTMVDLTFQTDWWADPMDIFAVTTGQVEGAILDARLDSQVRRSVDTGKPLMSMPMAQYVPSSFFTNDLDADNLSDDALSQFRAKLEDRGLDLGDGMLISVCQTGELSAVSWFYASEVVGIENVRYYPDALKGWESDGGVMFGMNTARDQ